MVVVTAAAGTGIGFAAAKRCAEEGAVVVISDAHERRLGEAADALAEVTGTRPLAVPCNVTVEAEVQRLYDTAMAEHGRIDVAINNAGLGGNAPIVDMTDEQWSTVLDITLTGTFRCMRAELRHMYGQGSGVDRQQRLGARLAGPGRPGPLRRGQGRRHGPHPLRGGGGGRRTACG